MDAEKIGVASLLLGAGRNTKEDVLDFSAGIILRAKTGDKVAKGTEITFVISKGPEYVVVPSVIDFNVETATTQLEEAGFVVKIIEKTNDGTHTANTVAEVSPEIGSSQIKGAEIQLYVWGEAPDDGFDWGFNDDDNSAVPGINLGDIFDLFR
jgi:hypothetical protein